MDEDFENEISNFIAELEALTETGKIKSLERASFFVESVVKSLIKHIVAVKPKINIETKKYDSAGICESLEVLMNMILELLFNTSMMLDHANSIILTENVLRCLNLMVPFSEPSNIRIVPLGLVEALSYLPLESRQLCLVVISRYYFPMYSMQNENEDEIGSLSEMILLGVLGMLGSEVYQYTYIVESIIYWSHQDLLTLLTKTSLSGSQIVQELCLKLLMHYLSPLDPSQDDAETNNNCGNIFCHNPKSMLKVVVMDHTTAVVNLKSIPPISLCDVCSHNIVETTRNNFFLFQKYPLMKKMLSYNPNLSADKSFTISCQRKNCFQSAEFLSFRFGGGDDVVSTQEFLEEDSNEALFMAQYLCYTCHQQQEHQQCQYLLVFSQFSKFNQMVDLPSYKTLVDLLLKNVEELEGLTLLLESDDIPLETSLQNIIEQYKAALVNFVLLGKFSGFVIFFKENTFHYEDDTRYSLMKWSLRSTVLKSPEKFAALARAMVVGLSLLCRAKNEYTEIEPVLIKNLLEWNQLIYEHNAMAFNESLVVKKLAPETFSSPQNFHYIHYEVRKALRVFDVLASKGVLNADTKDFVFDQLIDLAGKLAGMHRQYDSDSSIKPSDIEVLKSNVRQLYELVFGPSCQTGEGAKSSTSLLKKRLIKGDAESAYSLMWKLRLLNHCGVQLSLQDVADCISEFIDARNTNSAKLSSNLSQFLLSIYCDNGICFRCHRSDIFLSNGYIKGLCCTPFSGIFQPIPVVSSSVNATMVYISLDLLLSQLVFLESKVCIGRNLSEKGNCALIYMVIDLLYLFSQDGQYPACKEYNKSIVGTVYFVVLAICSTEMPKAKETIDLSYRWSALKSLSNKDKSKFNRICREMVETGENDGIDCKIKLCVIVSQMLFIMSSEDEYHDVVSAFSLVSTIRCLFFDKGYFESKVLASGTEHSPKVKGFFLDNILPALWTCQKYNDISTSHEVSRILDIILQTDEGFELVTESTIDHIEVVLSKLSAVDDDEVSNIHEDTSNLELLEQLSICLYCMCYKDDLLKENQKRVSFVVFCASLLVMLQDYPHPSVSCLSTEFMKNFPEPCLASLVSCIDIQYSSVKKDRVLMLLLAKAMLELVSFMLDRKSLVNWWRVTFSDPREGERYAYKGHAGSSVMQCHSISGIRVFKEVFSTSMSSMFVFPKNFPNHERNYTKQTSTHSLFVLLCTYTVKMLSMITNTSISEDLVALNVLLSGLLNSLDSKYSKWLLGIPFGKASHVFLENFYHLVDHNFKVGEFFLSSIIGTLSIYITIPTVSFLPTKNLLLLDKTVENVNQLIDVTVSPKNGIVSLLPEERHIFIKMLNLLLYKYDLTHHAEDIHSIMEHILDMLDGHIHICYRSKFENQHEEAINEYHHHQVEELKRCSLCHVPIFKVDEVTVNLAMLSLLGYHLHHMQLASPNLIRTINLYYKFIYYDPYFGPYKAVDQKEKKDYITPPPVPTSLSSIATRCLYQLLVKLKGLNFVREIFKVDFLEPYPMFYTIVYCFVANDSHEAVLEFIAETCQQLFEDFSDFSEVTINKILQNVTYLLYCTRNVLLTKDTYCTNYRVMTIRKFLPPINLDVVYGIKSTVFKSEKINITSDLLIKIDGVLDGLFRTLITMLSNEKVSVNTCATLVGETIKLSGPTCFYYNHLVPLCLAIFEMPKVELQVGLEISIEWFCVSADDADKLLLFERLIDNVLRRLTKLVHMSGHIEHQIGVLISFLSKIGGTNITLTEYFDPMDESLDKVITIVETIPEMILKHTITQNIDKICQTVSSFYHDPTSGQAHKHIRGVVFIKRMEITRLPMAQMIAVAFQNLPAMARMHQISHIYPHLHKLFKSQKTYPYPDQDWWFSMKDVSWLLLGWISHDIHKKESLHNEDHLLNDLQLGSVFMSLHHATWNIVLKSHGSVDLRKVEKEFEKITLFYEVLCAYSEMCHKPKAPSHTMSSQFSDKFLFTPSNLWFMLLEKLLPLLADILNILPHVNKRQKKLITFALGIYRSAKLLKDIGFISPGTFLILLEPVMDAIEEQRGAIFKEHRKKIITETNKENLNKSSDNSAKIFQNDQNSEFDDYDDYDDEENNQPKKEPKHDVDDFDDKMVMWISKSTHVLMMIEIHNSF